jgi:hypothetical protein
MRNLQRIAPLVVALAVFVGGWTAGASANNAGFLYGTVTTESGTEYTGFLRWGSQEAFWDDLFHSLKQDLPYRDDVEQAIREERERSGRVKVFNWSIKWESDGWDASRIFIARFGDIREIRVTGDEDADVQMKSGQTYRVSGYSDDVGGTINVVDESFGEIDVKWDRIETIRFQAAPTGKDPGASRLWGLVETDAGEFEGFIQWDKEECMSTDLLDGEAEDGKVSIELGNVRSIERRGRSSSIVVLDDGRKLRLRGSNDVNDDNRGIMVQTSGFGRVTIDWDDFQRVDFRAGKGSGRGYDDYPAAGWLRGTVTDTEDRTARGRIVLDLDEAEGWEMLNGSYRRVKFDIPLIDVAEIVPISRDESRILLRNGETVELEEGQDVTDRNDGVLVYGGEEDPPTYVAWEDIEHIRFD